MTGTPTTNRCLAQARALGVPVAIVDATQSQTHRMVDIADAKAVAVLTSADRTNVETRTVGPRITGRTVEQRPRSVARLRFASWPS